jgi:hypothetical protein
MAMPSSAMPTIEQKQRGLTTRGNWWISPRWYLTGGCSFANTVTNDHVWPNHLFLCRHGNGYGCHHLLDSLVRALIRHPAASLVRPPAAISAASSSLGRGRFVVLALRPGAAFLRDRLCHERSKDLHQSPPDGIATCEKLARDEVDLPEIGRRGWRRRDRAAVLTCRPGRRLRRRGIPPAYLIPRRFTEVVTAIGRDCHYLSLEREIVHRLHHAAGASERRFCRRWRVSSASDMAFSTRSAGTPPLRSDLDSSAHVVELADGVRVRIDAHHAPAVESCLVPVQARDAMDAHFVLVGDYVDRGPDPKGVIDFLIGNFAIPIGSFASAATMIRCSSTPPPWIARTAISSTGGKRWRADIG